MRNQISTHPHCVVNVVEEASSAKTQIMEQLIRGMKVVVVGIMLFLAIAVVMMTLTFQQFRCVALVLEAIMFAKTLTTVRHLNKDATHLKLVYRYHIVIVSMMISMHQNCAAHVVVGLFAMAL